MPANHPAAGIVGHRDLAGGAACVGVVEPKPTRTKSNDRALLGTPGEGREKRKPAYQ
jgi:hypothetical protein